MTCEISGDIDKSMTAFHVKHIKQEVGRIESYLSLVELYDVLECIEVEIVRNILSKNDRNCTRYTKKSEVK